MSDPFNELRQQNSVPTSVIHAETRAKAAEREQAVSDLVYANLYAAASVRNLVGAAMVVFVAYLLSFSLVFLAFANTSAIIQPYIRSINFDFSSFTILFYILSPIFYILGLFANIAYLIETRKILRITDQYPLGTFLLEIQLFIFFGLPIITIAFFAFDYKLGGKVANLLINQLMTK